MAIIFVSFNPYLTLVLIRLCYIDTLEQASDKDVTPLKVRNCNHLQLYILYSASWSKLILLTISALQLFHGQSVPKSALVSSPLTPRNSKKGKRNTDLYKHIHLTEEEPDT